MCSRIGLYIFSSQKKQAYNVTVKCAKIAFNALNILAWPSSTPVFCNRLTWRTNLPEGYKSQHQKNSKKHFSLWTSHSPKAWMIHRSCFIDGNSCRAGKIAPKSPRRTQLTPPLWSSHTEYSNVSGDNWSTSLSSIWLNSSMPSSSIGLRAWLWIVLMVHLTRTSKDLTKNQKLRL